MLKENINFIKKYDLNLLELLYKEDYLEKSVEIDISKSGLPTLKVNIDSRPMFLHSKYNPEQEVESIISNLGNIDQYEYFFFYGIGLGYLAEELLKRYPDKKFAIVEPSIDVFKHYMNEKAIRTLPVQQLSFLKVGLTEKETKGFIKEFFNHVQERTLLVTLPSYERFIPEQYKSFIDDFKKIVEESRQGILIDYSFQKRWTLNSWINFPQTLMTANVLHDFNIEDFKDFPAIIVSAGPSLNDELENLKHIKEKGLAYIFSVGSAINTLIENGIYPDAMCTYDPTVLNQEVFKKVVTREIDTVPMIYGTSVGFETLKKYQGPKIHMVTTQDTISNFYLKREDKKENVKVHDAPSIAVVTLELLNKLGCNPIILVGQNLAYKNNQAYSKDIDYDFAPNEVTVEELSKALKVNSVEGEVIYTDEFLNRIRSQFEYYLSNIIKDTEVINTTKGGAQIEGTTFKDLSLLITERLEKNQINKEWYKYKKNNYDLHYLEQQQQEMKNKYSELSDSLKNLKKLFNKMEQLIVERRIVKLERMFNKFDIEMKKFVQNDFYLTFLQPMSRVEFDLLTKDINALKFDNDMISKSKKTIKSFKRFVNSCEFDLINMKTIFEEVNTVITAILKERKQKDVSDGN